MNLNLNLTPRTLMGRKAKTLRIEGIIPAEIYGHKIENKHVAVAQKEFAKIYKIAGEHTIVSLVIEGEKEPTLALIADATYSPMEERFTSVDFRVVQMNEKIEAKIPIEFLNEAPAVQNGFLIVTPLNELEVKALPNDLPHKIEVDLSSLQEIGQSIHVKDVRLGKNVEILSPLDTVIVTVTEKAKKEENPPPSVDTTTETPVVASEEKVSE